MFRLFKRRPRFQFPELKLTGGKTFDQHCLKLWKAEEYDQLVEDLTLRIAKIDDHKTLKPEKEALLRTLRRNEILCEAVSQLTQFGDPSRLHIEFMGMDLDDTGCPFYNVPRLLTPAEYLTNPDTLPCETCSARGRKYFCGIVIRSNE